MADSLSSRLVVLPGGVRAVELAGAGVSVGTGLGLVYIGRR